MADTPSLYSAQGKLVVRAKGYWFSGGGNKGSFGYYPHLKDKNHGPVYPDTQVQGNLRMAAEWLNRLCLENKNKVSRLFGKSGNQGPSLIKVTDLSLTSTSSAQWSESRFQIKTRIKIDGGTKTVAPHFLADFELAYLEGLELSADIFLGYYNSREECQKAITFLEEAISLVPGFGAFRSRGYGKGNAQIYFSPLTRTKFCPTEHPEVPSRFLYCLKTLVNFRSKTLGSANRQTISSRNHIQPEQLRGWFVKAWYILFQTWPSAREMDWVSFLPLYPTEGKDWVQAFPPPVSTLMDENGKIEDQWGKTETHLEGKCSPLSEGFFVTAENRPEAIQIQKYQRIRNKLDEQFITGQNSLFAQEFFNRGTCFSGTIEIKDDDPKFFNKAIFILKNLNPVINGTPMLPEIKKAPVLPEIGQSASSFLVIRDIPYSPELNYKGNSVRIHSGRRYNTVLKRQKRNQVLVSASSVFDGGAVHGYEEYCIPWKGFGRGLDYRLPSRKQTKPLPPLVFSDHELVIGTEEYMVSKSQAGLLRELLHPNLSKDYINRVLEDRIAKHDEKENQILLKVLTFLKQVLDRDDRSAMQDLCRRYLESVSVIKWNKRNKNGIDKQQ